MSDSDGHSGEPTPQDDHTREPGGSRRGRWLVQLPFLIVLVGVLLGLLWVGLHHFKRGSVLIATSLVFGSVLRLILSDRQAGALAVRSRPLDAISLGGLGLLLAIAAVVVPPPS